MKKFERYKLQLKNLRTIRDKQMSLKMLNLNNRYNIKAFYMEER